MYKYRMNVRPYYLLVHVYVCMYIEGLAQWVGAFVPQADGWVFESEPRQTYIYVSL